MKATFTIVMHDGGRIELKPETARDYTIADGWHGHQKKHGPITLALDEEKPRSLPHHNKFFAVIDAAFSMWPEQHEFQPEDAEHLRQWLEVKVGHRKHIDFPVTEDNAHYIADVISAFAKGIDGKAVFPRFGRDVVRVYWADTVSWKRLGQKQFNEVSRPVFEEIENVIGVSVDQLRKEKAA